MMRVYSKHKKSGRFALKIWSKKINLYLKINSIWMIFRYKINFISDIEQKITKLLVNIAVAPFVGVWIEIKHRADFLWRGACRSLRGSVDWNSLYDRKPNMEWCRSLRGSVDWNSWGPWKHSSVGVAPFVGVWIEIDGMVSKSSGYVVAPFVGVWIEI